jgi:hypothetical protein
MNVEYTLGDKVILAGLTGFWEIVEIETLSDSTKRYALRIEADHRYKDTDLNCVDFLCSEKIFKKLTSRN